jgi:hypothetical protein
MPWIDRDGASTQRIRSREARWTPQLDDEVTPAPPGAIAPDRGTQLDGERHLLALGLDPRQLAHKRIGTIAHPIHVSGRAVECERETSFALHHLKRHSLRQRDAQDRPVDCRHHADGTNDGRRLGSAGRQRQGLRYRRPCFRDGGQAKPHVIIHTPRHCRTGARGKKPAVGAPGYGSAGRQAIGGSLPCRIIIERSYYGKSVEQSYLKWPACPNRISAQRCLHGGPRALGRHQFGVWSGTRRTGDAAQGCPSEYADQGSSSSSEHRPCVGTESSSPNDTDVSHLFRSSELRGVPVKGAQGRQYLFGLLLREQTYALAVWQAYPDIGSFDSSHRKRQIFASRKPDLSLGRERHRVDPGTSNVEQPRQRRSIATDLIHQNRRVAA